MDIVTLLNQNPALVWGGLIFAVIIFLITKHLESQEEERKPPEPSELDEIVRPKVKAHLETRGVTPGQKTFFKIGRDPKGVVNKYVDTELPKDLINPNPEEPNTDIDPEDVEQVRILSVRPESRVELLLEKLQEFFTRRSIERKIYVFRLDSFLDTPGLQEMIVEGDTMSYQYGGLEVELIDSAKNVVHQAVESEVSEKLLASLPNYTEKIDFLFPIHSQNVKMEKEKSQREGDW